MDSISSDLWVRLFDLEKSLIIVTDGVNGYGRDTIADETMKVMELAHNVDNVLVIGFRTGAITESVLKAPGLRKLTIVELNRALIKNLTKMDLFSTMLADPRVSLKFDDGRRHLLSSDEQYDVILMDPLRTTTSYSNNIYSKEFFELVARHLRPGGTFLVWTDDERVLLKTLAGVFQHVEMYDLYKGDSYRSYFCVASMQEFGVHPDRAASILSGFNEGIRQYVNASSGIVKYLRDEDAIRAYADHYPISEDLKPVSEYYLGLRVRELL